MVSMAFFGAIGALSSSWFPISLGAVLFFTDEEFIEWALQAIGIRLVPDTLGPAFIKTFVFLVGWYGLLAYWRDSAPEWLYSWIPPGAPPWSFVGGAALLIAVLSTASTAVLTYLLPEIARRSLTWKVTRALIAVVIVGVLALFVYAFRPLQTRVSEEFPQAARISLASASINCIQIKKPSREDGFFL